MRAGYSRNAHDRVSKEKNALTDNINTMSTDFHSEPPLNQPSEAAREIARRASAAAQETSQNAAAAAKHASDGVEDSARDVWDVTRHAARRATDAAKDMCQSAALQAGDTLAASKVYVRRNPLPVVLGAIAFGAAIGYMLMRTRRKPTFGERYAEEPLAAVHEAILRALAPVAQRVHEGYDAARDGAGKAMHRVQAFGPGHKTGSFPDRVARLGNNLKFW